MQRDEALHVDRSRIADTWHAARRGGIVGIFDGADDAIPSAGGEQHLGCAGGKTGDSLRHVREGERAPEVVGHGDSGDGDGGDGDGGDGGTGAERHARCIRTHACGRACLAGARGAI